MAATSQPIVFNNTVLRDGHQSLAATRMATEQMLPACETLDSMGFGCLETWGGATIDSGLRFLDEWPFDRLDALRKATPNTKHMMLLRGQNIVGYTHYPDDVVETFVKKAAEHGMDIFRIFDALNDMDNIRCAVKAAKDAGKEAHGVMCYTSSPVHNPKTFIDLGLEIEKMGCDAIVIKDMAGLIPPYICAAIVSGLKEKVKIPVWVHTHETAGLGAATYLAAIEAGADAVDTSIIPFANGTAQPDTSRMLALMENHSRCPDYDTKKLMELRDYFTKIYKELSDYTSMANEVVNTDALIYQVPGGMLSNFRNQLKEQKMTDRFEEVMKEIPVVREALGWIPLVTPTSQIVGFQSVLNVKFGRWKNFSPQAMDVALGYYGKTPAEVDPEVRKLAAEKSGKEPIDCRPADLKDPGMDQLREELKEKNLPTDDEHCVIYAMFPSQVEAHHKPAEEKAKVKAAQAEKAAAAQPAPASSATQAKAAAPAATPPAGSGRRMVLTINGAQHEVTIEEVE